MVGDKESVLQAQKNSWTAASLAPRIEAKIANDSFVALNVA